MINDRDIVPRMFCLNYEHVGHLLYYNDTPDDPYPQEFRWGDAVPKWMYRLPPFRLLDAADHLKYMEPSIAWAEASELSSGDVA